MPTYTLLLSDPSNAGRSPERFEFTSSRELAIGDTVELRGRVWRLTGSPERGTFTASTSVRQERLIDLTWGNPGGPP